MRKVFNVVVNEYIKIFAKISTKIMLACIVLLAVFWSVGSYIDYYRRYSDTMGELDYEELKMRNGGSEDAMYDEMKELGIKYADDWRYEAYQRVYYDLYWAENQQPPASEQEIEEAKKRYERFKKTITDNDFKEYIRLQIEKTEQNRDMPEGEKELELWKLQYQLDHDIPPTSHNKLYQALTEYSRAKYEIAGIEQQPSEAQDKKRLGELKEDEAIFKYVLDKKIESYIIPDRTNNYYDADGFWSVFSNSTMLLMVINVLIIIVAGSIISAEFSSGTVKFLLINPIKRWKILVAKYLSVLTVGIVMLVIYYIFNLILNGIFFGFGDIVAPSLTFAAGKVRVGSGLLYVAWKYILGSVGVLTMATFAFAVSSLVRNSALAIGLGVFLMLSGYGAVFVLAEGFNMDWARYILFANTDINLIISQQTPFLGHTVTFALIVIAVYMVVFLLTAWDAFVRRDVK